MENATMSALFRTIADNFTKLSELCASAEESEKPIMSSGDKLTNVEQKLKTTPTEESPVEETPENKAYTKEDVRAKLAQMSKADEGKYKADVKAIVARYSSDGRLSGIPADKYADVVAALEVVCNA